uniref:WASH complex subunit 3 n=1 Tax=Meleagris gallopavo TaxID=9103 RepID=A0A803YN03_MELGA
MLTAYFDYVLSDQLSSIPGLEDVKFEVSSANLNNVTSSPMAPATTDQQQNNKHEEALQKTEIVTENMTTVAKDPRYARYLKMVQVGVPVMAIRNKMISEGLNPDLLDKFRSYAVAAKPFEIFASSAETLMYDDIKSSFPSGEAFLTVCLLK